MKRILLTSTAMVAFAGAAAADISFSGTAEFSYNSLTATYGSDTTITAAASQELNNGYTASVSFTIDPDALTAALEGDEDAITAGSITISNDSSSITYHGNPGSGVGAAYIGTGASDMMTDNEITFGDDGDDQVNETAEITASTTMAGATIRASLDGSDLQLGVSTDLGGTALDAGFDNATGAFGLQIGGDASGVSYTLGMDSENNYGLNAGITAGGADITVDFGDAGWKVGASMPLGVATVGVSLTDQEAWEVTVDTALDAVALGMTVSKADWSMTADYAAGDVTLGFSTDKAGEWALDAGYDLGNGITAGAGTSKIDGNYVDVAYDLGGGASATIMYGSQEDAGADDIAEGTTIKVSFAF